MKEWINSNYKTLAGIAIGGILGFMYYKFYGCESGTCMISSSPVNSTLYGSVMGYLLAGAIFSKSEKDKKEI